MKQLLHLANKGSIDHLRFAIASATDNTFSVVFIGFFIVVINWTTEVRFHTGVWVLSFILFFYARKYFLTKVSGSRLSPTNQEYAFQLLWVSTVGCAAVVFIGIALLFPALTDSQRAYLSMIIATWAVGSMASLGAIPRLFTAYFVFFILGIVLGWLRSDSNLKVETSLLIAVFMTVALRFSASFANFIDAGIAIRTQN